jgi:TPP-dependent pyruvate/acetoin dehydrogenase alpha subunit
MEINKKELLLRMERIRKVEETIADKYSEQEMRCPTHLSIGQELVGAASGMIMRATDYAVSTHRGHAHYLGKGGDMKAMIAEIYGKVDGCARGRGGSMHLIDQKVGFMGTTAIVGNSIPIGVGLGLSIKMAGDDRVSAIFLGDGCIEEGVFYEAANFSAVQKLPVVFICENNLYSVYSPLEVRQPKGRIINKMVQGLGLKTFTEKGENVEDTYECLSRAINHARDGYGPVFVEISAYRWREHCGPNYDNDLSYRSEEEFMDWKARDPLNCYRQLLLESGQITQADLEILNVELNTEVTDAFAFASNSAFPDNAEAYLDEYAP